MRTIIAFLLLAVCAGAAHAAGVALIGVIGDKAAVLAVDGGNPKAVKVGQTWNGITVLEVRKGQATVEEDGKKRVLVIGMHYRGVPPPPAGKDNKDGKPAKTAAVNVDPSGRPMVVLPSDGDGHVYTTAYVNGVIVRFLVDTGATLVTLPAGDALRVGIDYQKGTRGVTNTANGTVAMYQVKIDILKLGDIELNNVDAMVLEGGLSIGLLGMSFLNRVEMRRDGEAMTLTKRF